jgi:glycosyltransferase involved in cell wall biosynthesis
MRLAMLAARNSIHTVRWANALSERGYTVHLISQHQGGDPLHATVRFYQLPAKGFSGYFLNAPKVKRLLAGIEPDLVHAHYASGYGTLGRLSGFHPFVLSVWGTDVYDFPYKSFLHRRLMAGNLQAADWVCSTSQVMARQTRKLWPGLKNMTVTPFGIDVNQFQPSAVSRQPSAISHNITIGTVKTLRAKYGIDLLIRAFAKVRQQLPDLADRLRLLIVGGGPQQAELEALATQLNLSDYTTFSGPVRHAEVPGYLRQLNIYIAASRDESFGVAVVEASACGLPVIVSNVGGLPEVVEDGVTGLVVENENSSALAEAMICLVKSPALRRQMGAAGRRRVLEHYRWEDNVTTMEAVYQAVMRGT